MAGAGVIGRERWLYGGLAVLPAAVWLAILGVRPLFNPDEGRYAEIPREMLAGGDWIIPHLNGLAYIEKPPLQFWITALSFKCFGEGEFAARLYVALAALATIALIGWVARDLWNEAVAWRAAAVLASMALFVVVGQLLSLDMSLTLYTTASLAGFLIAQRGAPRTGMLLAWVATALGVLTKGVVAAAIPAAVLILYSLISRDIKPWRRLGVAWGLPLFLGLTVPWHWLAARRDPGFLEFFFVHEHLARYLTPVAQRVEPWWFFGAVLLAGCMPWTLPALRVLGTGWRARSAPGEFNAALFLWIWVMFVLVFFSLSDSKLIPYILPALPALALLIGAQPPRTLERDFKLTAGASVLIAVALAVLSFNLDAVLSGTRRAAVFSTLAHPLYRVAALLLVSGAFVLAERTRDATRSGVFLGVGWCLGLLLTVRAAALTAPIYSGVQLAAALPSVQGAPFYSIGTYDQSLTFYLRRTVTLVAYRGELDYGLEQSPGAEIADQAEFLQLWSAAPSAFAVMEKSMFESFKQRAVPMRLIAQNADRVVVARR